VMPPLERQEGVNPRSSLFVDDTRCIIRSRLQAGADRVHAPADVPVATGYCRQTHPWAAEIVSMNSRGVFLLLTLLGSVLSVQSHACLPSIDYITDFVFEPQGPLSICVFPNRAPSSFQAVLRFPVILIGNSPEPHPVPIEWWFGGPGVVCAASSEGPERDAEGWVSLMPTIRGGGHNGPGDTGAISLWIPVCPNQILELGGGLYFNSPDISGDLRIDLSDVGLFAGDFHGSYAYRSDFNWDGAVNLSDIGFMAGGMGESCP